jgi:hypothetical protein
LTETSSKASKQKCVCVRDLAMISDYLATSSALRVGDNRDQPAEECQKNLGKNTDFKVGKASVG